VTSSGLEEKVVCAGKVRLSHIYTSQSHVVSVTVLDYMDTDPMVDPAKFFIKFEGEYLLL